MPSTNSTAHTAGPNIERVIEFAWGYRNYVGGSDDWRCDAVYGSATDEYGEPLYEDYEPCECAACDGATAREWDRGKPSLSTRVMLNLAAIAAAKGGVS